MAFDERPNSRMMRTGGRPRSPGELSESAFAGTGNAHLSYSSFSHISDINSLSFAVGLRPGDDAEDDLVGRMLPLAKIEPGQVIERKIRSVKKKEEEDEKNEQCSRPDCLSDRDRVKELSQANEQLRSQLEELENQYRTSVSKFEAVEKANLTSEETNDKLLDQLNEIRANKQLLEIEAERANLQKDEIKNRMNAMTEEIEQLKKQTEEKEKARIQSMTYNGMEVVFGKIRSESSEEARLIRDLEKWDPIKQINKSKSTLKK
eukprot:CAMPEP_0117776064 /NCGR_PEP_ID=MMETSP0947-20121206/27527_1 /TAXON_ID=44440 /ORGANISM="Chattonella subsalsa, Strain CCMP2191" /LENGTH=261 /DNA_ID=CAMNT_0005602923 /DNA_START=53 /DNA_END=838 /DNA_ORIENTATION=-